MCSSWMRVLSSACTSSVKMNILRSLSLACCCIMIRLQFSNCENMCPDNFECECKTVMSSVDKIENIIDCSNRSIVSLPHFGDLTGKQFDKLFLNSNKISRLLSGSFRGLTVKSLDLSNNHIKSLSDKAFTDITELEELTMVNCGLSSSPAAFEKLPNLKRLDLHSNKIRQLSTRAFGRMSKLEYLDLHNNPVDFASPFTSFDNMHDMKELNLHNCGLVNIPHEAIGHMSKLVNLNLGRNNIHGIPEGLFNDMTKLVHLDLSSNPVTFAATEKVFQGLLSVKTLKMSGCHCRNNTVQKNLLKNSPRIRKFTLASCNISHIEAGLFAHLDHLHYLDLSGNKFPLKKQTFLGVTDTVHTLKLNHRNLPIFPYDFFLPFKNLKRIYVEYNKIEKLPADLFRSLKHGDMHIHLEGNLIKSIANRVLWGAPRPVSLHLENNKLTNLEFISEDPCQFAQSTIYVSGNPITCDCDVYSAMQMKAFTVNGVCEAPAMYEGLKLSWLPGKMPEEDYLEPHTNVSASCNKGSKTAMKYDCGCNIWMDFDDPNMCPFYSAAAELDFTHAPIFYCISVFLLSRP